MAIHGNNWKDDLGEVGGGAGSLTSVKSMQEAEICHQFGHPVSGQLCLASSEEMS